MILFCRCSDSEAALAESRRQILGALESAHAPYQVVHDLCELSARKDPDFAAAIQDRPLKIVACYPRTVKWLLHAHGGGGNGPNASCLSLRTESPEAIIRQCLENQSPALNGAPAPLGRRGNWVPWFPVIDYDRCKNCKQCVSFCLFGVYGLDAAGKVKVVNPQNCKTNCPACARICPDVAIIFPKFNQKPINGAPIEDEAGERARVKVDLQSILGSNVYGALAERRKRARSLLITKPGLGPQFSLTPVTPPPPEPPAQV